MVAEVGWKLLTAYSALLLSALLPIVAGSHASLRMSKSSRRRYRKLKGETALEDDEDDDDEIDRLTSTDAYLFPLIGSVVLLTLYCAFKYLDKAMVNKLLSGYFIIMQTGALGRMGVTFVRAVVSEERWSKFDKYRVVISKNKVEETNFSFTKLHVLSVISSIVLTILHQYYSQHWIISNFIALSFSFNAINLLRLDSFLTGTILLSGLFLYDIFWVFATPVMVSVATQFDAPIKIVFPRDVGDTALGFTLLGLGDIVIPGIFLALALRFDFFLATEKARRSAALPPKPSTLFPRPYFFSAFIAYIAGLTTTIVVMHTFQAAQPALLYLSPATIFSLVGCGWIRGELKDFWAFDDGSEDEPRKVVDVEGEKGNVESKAIGIKEE